MVANETKQLKLPKAEIAIIGGSGFYELLTGSKEVDIETPFGKPSDTIKIGTIDKRKIAFLPRHGASHKYPPHKIPYQANMWALKKLGIKKILAPLAVGSLNPLIKPGDFVIVDQFVNWTKNRQDTYFNGKEIEGIKKSNKIAHISAADPYCPTLRKQLTKNCKKLNISHHETGTVIVIEGPRFSTKAESKFFSNQGFDIINMTAYPEGILARELGMCYINIGLVTDWDAGLVGQGNIKPVTTKQVIEVFNKNNQIIKNLIFESIRTIPKEIKCHCPEYIKESFI